MLLGSIAGTLLGFLMGFLSLFLILLILVQRGRGGGLTGALGGPGGQSAFGSKAGDTFTLITVIIATVWGFSCAFTMWLLGTHTPSVSLTKASINAGPGDDGADPANRMTLPPMDGLGSGATGLGGLDSGLSDGNATKPANDVELVPANAAAEPGTEPAMEAGEAEAPGTETPAAPEAPATPASATPETPAPETPPANEPPPATEPSAATEPPAAEPAPTEKTE